MSSPQFSLPHLSQQEGVCLDALTIADSLSLTCSEAQKQSGKAEANIKNAAGDAQSAAKDAANKAESAGKDAANKAESEGKGCVAYCVY